MAAKQVKINRAPVLTLWAAVVAERLGYDEEEALTLGRAVAGLNAQSKGRRLGIYEEPERAETEEVQEKPAQAPQTVSLLGRAIPARKTEQGWRALSKGEPIDPDSVRRYLEKKFGEDLAETRAAMAELAGAYAPRQLAGRAYDLYEQFRPEIPEGKKGWGAAGLLDLDLIRKLGRSA
ncbi:MAG TPA: hypothetical protein VNK95_23665 [Caldilineaceae bacterium]|nr:hypothetical protein [Caldilineaceae bacterium]